MELQHSTMLVTGAIGNTGSYVVDQPVNEGATVIGTYVNDAERTDAEARTNQSAAVPRSQMTGGQIEVGA